MRAKIIVPVFALSALLIALAFFLRHSDSGVAQATSQTAPTAAIVTSELPSPPAQIRPKPIPLRGDDRPARFASGPDSTSTGQDAAVTSRIAELNRLAMTSDPHSLDTILGELSNRDPKIRLAAISATIDFGSRDAIPALQNAMGWTDDLKEKVEIQRAIDFLQLPSAIPQDHTSAGASANK